MPHPVLHRVGIVLLAGLLSGGHWALLQGVAWTGMLIRYSAEADLSSGIRRTFDGQHPCAMCNAIEDAREAEQDPARPAPTPSRDEFRLTALAPEAGGLLGRSPGRHAYAARAWHTPQRTREAPPVPPPRPAA